MSIQRHRLLTSASLLALGLIAGLVIAQVGSAGAAPQQPQQTAMGSAPDLEEVIPQGAFVRVADETQQALVFIRTEQVVSGASLMEDFRRFFGDDEEAPDVPEDQVQQSSGSGFLISADGYIVTNAHVISQTDVNAREIDRADEVTVRLNNDDEFSAEIVGVDIGTDLAVLKIDSGYDLPYLSMGNSEQARVGEWVLALGAPFGLTNTVSAGIISAKGRAPFNNAQGSAYQDFIQTDAAINTGNSGGPLVNLRGEVIGINTMIISSGFRGQFSGVGFAIPIDLVSGVVDQLIQHGRTIRGWLGISMRPLTQDLADAYGLDRREVRGAVEISDVNPGEPADQAGIKDGDIVLGTDGREIEDNQDFLQRIAVTPPDDSITLDIRRMSPDDSGTGVGYEDASIPVTLGERPPEIEVLADGNAGAPLADMAALRNGMEDRELTAAEEQFGVMLRDIDGNVSALLEYRRDAGGIVIAGVTRSSVFGQIGIREGTIIRHINWRPVNSVEAFEELVAEFEPGETAVFDVRLITGVTARIPIEIPAAR